MIDIEKPTSYSKQHLIILSAKLTENDIIFNSIQDEEGHATDDIVNIKLSMTYPIHFRYQNPSFDREYEKSYLNPLPEFFLDCINTDNFPRYYNPFFTDELISNKIGYSSVKISS